MNGLKPLAVIFGLILVMSIGLFGSDRVVANETDTIAVLRQTVQALHKRIEDRNEMIQALRNRLEGEHKTISLLQQLNAELHKQLVSQDLKAYANYQVRAGDTIHNLAIQFGVTKQAVITANNLANPNLLYVGQGLKIPLIE